MPGWMRMALWKRKKGIGKAGKADNRGVSFVEVIVSMLIMAIAVIPLLGSFMMSLRVNMKSRQAMSATIVAQNVMECVKEYANNKMVKSNVGEDMKKYLPDAYQGGFLPSGDGFTLSNIREGVNDYKVEVKYNKSAFETSEKTGINDRKIPDLTTLDADSTLIVCQAGVINGSLESAARSFFFDQWVSRQWFAHADEEGYSGPNEEERAAASNNISLCMTSELAIEVSGTKQMPEVDAELRYMYDGMSYSAYHFQDSVRITEEKEKMNLYIFHDPLMIVGDPSGGYQIEDMVLIKNTGGFSWNLFFVVQESAACLGPYETENLSGPVFAMDWPYTGEPIALYCSTGKLSENQRISMNGEEKILNNASLQDEASLVETKQDSARMQKVTVNVYLQGTDEMLASMETDIMQ